jgi:hypothetical protein
MEWSGSELIGRSGIEGSGGEWIGDDRQERGVAEERRVDWTGTD